MGYNEDNMPECAECLCYNVGEVVCMECVKKTLEKQVWEKDK